MSDVPRPLSWGTYGTEYPEPPTPAWPKDRSVRNTTDPEGGLAITSLTTSGRWIVAGPDSWLSLDGAL